VRSVHDFGRYTTATFERLPYELERAGAEAPARSGPYEVTLEQITQTEPLAGTVSPLSA